MRGLLPWFIKLIVILTLIVVVFALVVNFTGGSCIKKIDKSAIAVQEMEKTMEWKITTPMHLYFAEKADVVTDAKGVVSVTMHGWYEQVSGKWIPRDMPITLERKNYGAIIVERRK